MLPEDDRALPINDNLHCRRFRGAAYKIHCLVVTEVEGLEYQLVASLIFVHPMALQLDLLPGIQPRHCCSNQGFKAHLLKRYPSLDFPCLVDDGILWIQNAEC